MSRVQVPSFALDLTFSQKESVRFFYFGTVCRERFLSVFMKHLNALSMHRLKVKAKNGYPWSRGEELCWYSMRFSLRQEYPAIMKQTSLWGRRNSGYNP